VTRLIVTNLSVPRTIPSLVLALAISVVLSAGKAHAQLGPVDGATATPIPGAGHNYIQDLVDTVSPADGSVSVRIKAPTPSGRGISLPFSFNYDSNGVHQPIGAPNATIDWASNVLPLSIAGWSYGLPQVTATSTPYIQTTGYKYSCYVTSSFSFQDINGTRHSLNIAAAQDEEQGCTAQGYKTVSNGGDDQFSAFLSLNDGPLYLSDASGTTYTFNPCCEPTTANTGNYPLSIEDRNGNLLTFSPPSPTNGVYPLTIQDTLGRNVVSISGLGATGNTVTISGLQNPYTLTWGTTTTNIEPANKYVGSGDGCNGFTVDSETDNVVTAIQLPDGQSFYFGYNSGSTGLVNQITYPSGAYVSYTYEQNPLAAYVVGKDLNGSLLCGYDYATYAVQQRQVYSPSGMLLLQQNFSYSTTWNSSGTQWTSKQTTVTTTDKVSGLVSTTVYTYTAFNLPFPPYVLQDFMPAPQLPLEQTVVYEDGSGNTLRTENKTWNDPFQLKTDLVTLPVAGGGSVTSETAYFYGPGDQVTEKDEYDFGTSGPGNLLRKTSTTYQAFTTTPIFTSATSIFDRPCQVITYDGGGNRLAETDTYYDNGSTGTVCRTAGTPSVSTAGGSNLTGHDETNYSASSKSPRGNATTVVRQCFQGATACSSGNPTTTYTFDETGQVLSTADPRGNTTSYAFGDSYSSTNTGSFTTTAGTPASGKVTNAYVTTITYPATNNINHIVSFAYGYNDGELTTSTDENQRVTTYRYNDNFDRLTETDYPDGGQTTIGYNDAGASPSVTTNKLISSSPSVSLTTTATTDGMGHVVQTQLTTDPDGTTYTATAYDGHGRTYQAYNPTRCSPPTANCGTETTWGLATYIYDALGRTQQTTEPDGSISLTSYSGNQTTVTDEVGNQRIRVVDGLGRLTEVEEPSNAPSTPASATVAISGGIESSAQPAEPGTGTLTITGSERETGFVKGDTEVYIWDAGSVSVTVNGHTTSAGYGDCINNVQSYDTSVTVAERLTAAINSDGGAYVTAVYANGVISLTSKSAGAATNYSLSASSVTTCTPYFPAGTTSFPIRASGSALTGGTNVTYIYDSGTVSATVNGCTASVPYSESGNNTSAAVAAALSASLSGACATYVSGTASGADVTLTTTATGPVADDYTLSATSASSNPSLFSSPSFTPSASTFGGGTDVGILTPLVTLYQYDALNNLTCAIQKGTDTTQFTSCASASATWRPRSFVYDSLARLTSATNPESGTITYQYDLDNNLVSKVAPKPGQTGTATVTTNYSYDALNRLTAKSYVNLSTPKASYFYDGATASGCTFSSITNPTNLIGRRSATCTADNFSSLYSYDPMGRPLVEKISNKGTTLQPDAVGYTYYLDGSLHTLTYPSGDVVTYTVGGAGRATQLSDSSNNYVGYSGSRATYAPQGALAGMINGYTGSFGGIVTSNLYNDRSQPIYFSTLGASGMVLNLCYDFHLAVAVPACNLNAYATGDNGNVFRILNNVDSTRSATFAYDTLNRISQANTINTTSPNCWGEVYTIDNWGNLTNRAGVSGMGTCYTEGLSATSTTQNQLNGIGLVYDSAGNVTNDGTGNTPTYDAENRIVTDASYTYFYDADGMRTEKASGSTGTMYWRGPGGEVLTETSLTGAIDEEYIYFGSERIARVDRPSGTVHYYFSNHLGSASVITDAMGDIEQQTDYYPFGGLAYTTGSDTNHYKFTGKERDSESNLDNFGARYFASTMGRFMTPDWAARPTAVPYAVFGDPQSLNLYIYVRNDPVTTADADGHSGPTATTPPDCLTVPGCGDPLGPGTQGRMSGESQASLNTYLSMVADTTAAAQAAAQNQAQGAGQAHGAGQQGDVATANHYLSGSKEMRLVQKAFKSGHFHLEIIHDGNDRYDPATRTVYWDPHSALETTDGGHQTPALGLGHEMAHATGNRHDTAGLSNTPDARFDNKEERRVILNYENPAARELGESTRSNHGGNPYNVDCPTCQ
jgi:RHS repeat-associated protein